MARPIASHPDPEVVDVAIVGGGVSGCYLGYRLATEGFSPVTLFELSDRIGGRLWSVPVPGLPGLWAELGGMRFHPEIHLVSDLIRHLGLDGLVTDFSFGEPENFTYVRGVRFRQKDLTPEALARSPDVLPYRLRPAEQGRGLDGLTALAVEAALPGFTALRRRYHSAFAAESWTEADGAAEEYEERKRSATLAGTPLPSVSWSGLLGATLSREAIHFLQDAGGYNTLASNGGAAGWLDNIFYTSPGARFQCLRGGFEALPRELHVRFQAAGGQTRRLHRLTRIDRGEQGGYELTFRREGDGGSFVRVRARRVVLTLPPRALELLEPDTFFLQGPGVRDHLRSVQSVGAVKLFLVYSSSWWEATGVRRGRSTTDLPLRQLWYFGGAEGGPALILASYANGAAAEPWRRIQGGEPFSPSAGAPFAGASRQMVQAAHSMLLEVHGVERAPLPSAACWQDWSADPFGGGWPVWREGYDPRHVIPALRQPLPDEDLYLAGDAWSPEPGSVQGALGTAECVLQDGFGLSWPRWLRRGGTRLGPRRRV